MFICLFLSLVYFLTSAFVLFVGLFGLLLGSLCSFEAALFSKSQYNQSSTINLVQSIPLFPSWGGDSSVVLNVSLA